MRRIPEGKSVDLSTFDSAKLLYLFGANIVSQRIYCQCDKIFLQVQHFRATPPAVVGRGGFLRFLLSALIGDKQGILEVLRFQILVILFLVHT